MSHATELMVDYAACHRDRRNITIHFLGIPLIVFAVALLLARPRFALGGLELTPAWVLWTLTTLWYLTRGHLALGLTVSLANAVLVALALPLAGGSTAGWLTWGCSAFALGWLMQCIGHYYEGRTPEFVHDWRGWVSAPMFVAAEALFAIGWCRPLLDEIERRAGPTMLRDLAHPVA
jgi:uncharacterized membrane protein YGL010W